MHGPGRVNYWLWTIIFTYKLELQQNINYLPIVLSEQSTQSPVSVSHTLLFPWHSHLLHDPTFDGWNLPHILYTRDRHIQGDRSTVQYQIQSPNHFLRPSLTLRLIVLLLMYLRRGSHEYVTLRLLKVLLTKVHGPLECHLAMPNQSRIAKKV